MMTKKFKAGIIQYAKLQTSHYPTVEAVVEATLKAHAMKGDDLYSWLGRHGYIWRTRYSRWELKK